ncbi:hypothetical protein EVAR_57444_1 [Eumeta japonica]|uniref:Uncharacterized protein n=1 Tax=Eumeta variegata TaxID=151549 RepID=A0A4C1ZDW2_EUMVA|nr:hypothetical protein EVAR_57444_1 [Eumeta japonica]
MATFFHHIRRWIPYIVSKYSSRGIKRAQTRWGCRLITEFLWPPSGSIIRPWLPYSIKVGSSEFLWPPSSSIIRPCYHICISIRDTESPQLDGGGCLILLWPPPAPHQTPDYHIVKKYCQRESPNPNPMGDESNEPKLDGCGRLITEFLWPPSSSIIRPWLPYSIVRQEESNEPKLDGVASFNYGVPMATFQLHHQTLIPYSIKVLVKTNQTSPNSMGLRRLITEFHGHLQSSDAVTI